ncbi:MAG: hypothetical protein WCC73_13250, partial [Terracidiphilus sp.]
MSKIEPPRQPFETAKNPAIAAILVRKALANPAFYLTENERQFWTKRAVSKPVGYETDLARETDKGHRRDQRTLAYFKGHTQSRGYRQCIPSLGYL